MPRNPSGKGPKPPFHPDKVRQLIKVQWLVGRLHKNVENECMTPSQVRSAEILLRKCVPDLTHANVTGEVNVRYVVELPPVLTREEWLAKYGGNHLDLPAITSITGNGGGPH
jgi:hypothetical protein